MPIQDSYQAAGRLPAVSAPAVAQNPDQLRNAGDNNPPRYRGRSTTGAVEGNVNRIKMLKRQMYGRASFDLLRKRVLLAGRDQPSILSLGDECLLDTAVQAGLA